MEELKNIAVQTIEIAKQFGATSSETSINKGDGFSVCVRRGEVETIEYHQGKSLDITVYVGQRKASVSTSDLSTDAIKSIIKKAVDIAKSIEEDPESGLADADLLAYDYPDLNLYHPWKIEVNDAIDLAKECEKLAFTADKRITNSEGANLATGDAFYVYANSNGFIGSCPSSSHSISCSLIAGEGDGMQRDYSYTVACDANDLQLIAYVAEEAATKTTRRLGARTISTRACPVIFEANVAKGLLGSFTAAINGYNLYRKSSFLLDKLGQKIFPEKLTLDERPHLLKGSSSVPFDNEGVRTKDRIIIDKGVLQGYILDSYSGRKLKMPTTGNAGGIHNLFITAGDKNLDGLLKLMGKGILITELMGQDANIVTGDYSRAAFGFLVENGKIQYPIEGFTIAGNLKDMYLKIVEVANDVDHRSHIHTGSILIDNMTIGGVKS